MKKILSILLLFACQQGMAQRPDTLWYRYDNRFTAHSVYDISDFDTIDFKTSMMTLTKPNGESGKKSIGYPSSTTKPGRFMFTDPGRILYQPSSMTGDFTSSSNTWCFERSKESEHFVCFWEDGCTADIDYLLEVAEKTWDVYVDQLGFIIPGESSTDTYKIIIRAYNTTDWIASGSGEDLKVGTFNISPSAVTARGGHTVAHEIGHTFQYLTNVDCGADNTHGFNYGLGENGAGGNGFWEDCANWMGYKVYPERQFTDGEYFEGYLTRCHMNLMHEDGRYYNCFYQDYLCDQYGQNFIGRLWREAINPEDPVDAIMRMQDLDTDGFAQLMYECFAHMATWDFPSIREAASHRTGAHYNYLQAVDVDGEEWYQPDSAHCPQNYGYNITELKLPEAGTTIGIDFQGLTNADGYRHVYTARAGWRWGLVALNADGTTSYKPMQTDREGSISYTTTDDTERLWLVVMGAPTVWWHHEWDDDASDDEQWPYRIRTTGTRPMGIFHTYTEDDFSSDFVPHNDTIVVNAQLAYSSSSYSSVTVQYDMDAISEALGLTTEQLKAIQCSSSANPRFVGISKSGTVTSSTTTSTSSSTVLGHWFTTGGNVSNYDSSAAIYAEMTPSNWQCKVGQYPGRLTAGQTYVVRQGVIYTVNSVNYRVTLEVHLTVY